MEEDIDDFLNQFIDFLNQFIEKELNTTFLEYGYDNKTLKENPRDNGED